MPADERATCEASRKLLRVLIRGNASVEDRTDMAAVKLKYWSGTRAGVERVLWPHKYAESPLQLFWAYTETTNDRGEKRYENHLFYENLCTNATLE